MKTLLKKYEKKQITVNIPIDLFERIKLRARKEQRSISGQVVFLLAGGEPPTCEHAAEKHVFLPKGGEPPDSKINQSKNPAA
jgi:hypothetical protein